jgi:hypothetical protein
VQTNPEASYIRETGRALQDNKAANGAGILLNIDADFFLVLLYYVVVCDVADVSEVHPASIFSVDPEVEYSLYLQNAGYNVHNHTVQQPKNRTIINIFTVLQCKRNVPV